MTDYTNTYTEVTGNTIDTTDFSTEFTAIETAITSKLDVAGDTASNLTVNTCTLNTATIPSPTITSATLNTAVSGTAVLDEDDMASDSATQIATQQSIKAYADAQKTWTGRVSSTGLNTWGNSSVTTSRSSTGVYVLTHSLGSTNYSVVATSQASSYRCSVTFIGTSSCTITQTDTSGVAQDFAFNWIIQR